MSAITERRGIHESTQPIHAINKTQCDYIKILCLDSFIIIIILNSILTTKSS
jgi:hypothetical protein